MAVPKESLFLTKAAGQVPHTGGKLFGDDSIYYSMMLEWLQAGALKDTTAPPSVVKLEIYPPQAVIEGTGSTQRFIAVAHYSDETTRDVTNLSAFMTNNETSAAVDKNGNVTAGARGEAFIMARFEISQRTVRSVGANVFLQQVPPACVVKLVHQFRVLFECGRGCYLLHTMAFP